MIYAIIIFILWTWELTPTWVNVVCTVLCALAIINDIDSGVDGRD